MYQALTFSCERFNNPTVIELLLALDSESCECGEMFGITL